MESMVFKSNHFQLWKAYGLYIYSAIGGVLAFNLTWALNIRIWSDCEVNYMSIFKIPSLEPNTMKILNVNSTVLCYFMISLAAFYQIGRNGGQVKNHWGSVMCPIFLLVIVVGSYLPKLAPWKKKHKAGSGDSLTVFTKAVMLRCLTAPFSSVSFRDVYAADALTSFNKTIRDGVYGACWVLTGDFASTKNDLIDEDDSTVCNENALAVVSSCIVCFVLWIRMAQCMRRWYDSGAYNPHVFNIIKYMAALVVVVWGEFVSGYDPWYITFIVLTTLYKWWWDVVMDWGLCSLSSFHTPPYGLRTKLMYKDASVYYFCVALDLVLR
jgi:hypothetical protein